ncbi:OmpA family protein [Limibacter armeniacum]|uniref:OmpA family protein n=1 Tax=Limibacter armeniacum TaxID=466084 RepID=UPI002FE56672
MKTENLRELFKSMAMVMLLVLLSAGVIMAQDTRSSLFGAIDQTMETALEKKADVLTPKTYQKAMQHYDKASKAFEKGDDLSDIREELEEAEKYFNESIKNIDLANVMFSETLDARGDALKAGADQHQKDLWDDAEKEFRDAAEDLEGGDSDDAKEGGQRATELYRKAEMEAIETNLFGSANTLIEQAEDAKVKKTAPKTLESAKENYKTGIEMLEGSRYDTEQARELAQKAEYEARHALYLNTYIRSLKDEKKTMEDVILDSEDNMRKVAGAMGVESPEFDQGLGTVADNITERSASMRDSLNQVTSELEATEGKVSEMEGRLSEMSSLESELAFDKEVEEKYNQIFNMFDASQAEVFRQGKDIIMRMKGFAFDVGSSEVKPSNYTLLSDVRRAIEIFPDNKIIVEGHTDSSGSEATNMKLSQERADAVREYLVENMQGYDKERIKAEGFGENRPISSNKTNEGRAENRRIDVIIKVENMQK